LGSTLSGQAAHPPSSPFAGALGRDADGGKRAAVRARAGVIDAAISTVPTTEFFGGTTVVANRPAVVMAEGDL